MPISPELDQDGDEMSPRLPLSDHHGASRAGVVLSCYPPPQLGPACHPVEMGSRSVSNTPVAGSSLVVRVVPSGLDSPTLMKATKSWREGVNRAQVKMAILRSKSTAGSSSFVRLPWQDGVAMRGASCGTGILKILLRPRARHSNFNIFSDLVLKRHEFPPSMESQAGLPRGTTAGFP